MMKQIRLVPFLILLLVVLGSAACRQESPTSTAVSSTSAPSQAAVNSSTAADNTNAPGNDRITCESATGETIPMPTTYLYFEHNATAGDTGVHGMFDSSSFAELCVYDPAGRQILAVKPQNQLLDLTMAGIFFESREPEHSEVSVEDHLRNFPEGEYAIRAVAYDGVGYHGAAVLSHNLPKPPKMIFPPEMADEEDIKNVIVDPIDVVIKWQPVTETLFDDPVEIAGYEVIIRRLTPANPNGFAHANYDVHVLPTLTSLAVPNEFWEANTPYEWEVLALEASGNQTLVSGFFETGETAANTAIPATLPTIEITPTNFVNLIDNPYFPRIPGSKYLYEGQTENGVERVELEILHETKEILGITATIMRDTVYIDGEIVEDTYDWFAQDVDGNVWYFGEDVSDYEDGQLVSKDGSWEAGVDGALPGIVMYANPADHLGQSYNLEYYKGEAEDMADLLSVNESVTVPFGSFDNVVQTYDYTPLDPEAQEHKFFAPGIGEIKSIDLTSGDEVVLIEFISAESASQISCAGEGETVEISAARLYIEYNATDGDLGIHGGFDDHGWSELCVFAPNGDQILGVRPQAQLGDLTMASIFFEGREPELSKFSFDDLVASFPEGDYAVRALSFDGTILIGAATFSHNVPVAPVITAPALAEDEETAVEVIIPITNFIVTWNDVTETVNGDTPSITGNEPFLAQ